MDEHTEAHESRSDEEWRRRLSPEQYRVTRLKDTEPPFTGRFYHHHAPGTYTCVCCGEPLFESGTQYESGSGWPSFWAPIAEGRVSRAEDRSHGMRRTEITCRRCGAHLGHVFDDGPRPTGLRYCVNSASLDFRPAPGGGTPDE